MNNMSVALLAMKIGMNGIGFLSTYFSVGEYKIYMPGMLIGSVLMLMSIAIPEEWKNRKN